MDYWKKIGANETVLKILDEGYTIPFLTNPKCINLMNNRSALENHEFVTEEIKVLLRTGRIIETEKVPFVVNPLSVSFRNEKKRLILDCRHINPHIFKERVKFDDWKVMLQFVEQNGYMFNFDIKQGYYHIEN